MLVQFNARVKPVVAQKLRVDAVKNNRTLDAVVCSIFEDFFKSWSAQERAQFYNDATKPKRRGRRVKP